MAIDIMSDYQMLQCANCGNTEFSPFGDGGLICDCCNTKYTKKEIPKLKVVMEVKSDNSDNTENMYRRAKQFETFGDYSKAVSAYKKFADECPYDYRGWYGMTRLIDWETWFYQRDPDSKTVYPECCNRAYKTAKNEDVKAEIKKFCKDMKNKYAKKASDRRETYYKSVQQYREQIEDCQHKEKRATELRDMIGREQNSLNTLINEKILGFGFKTVSTSSLICFGLFSYVSCDARYKQMKADGIGLNERNDITTESLRNFFIYAAIIFIGIWLLWVIVGGLRKFFLNHKYSKLETKYHIESESIAMARENKAIAERELENLNEKHKQMMLKSIYLN